MNARNDVELERLEGESTRTLSAMEVDATLDASGKVEIIEARNNARMVLGADRILSSPKIRTTAAGVITTEGKSILEMGDSKVDGETFTIEDGEIIRFSTMNRAVLTSAGRRTTADRTGARFDRRTNQLVELTQTGNFSFEEGRQRATAATANFEDGGNTVTLEGSPVYSDADRRIEGGWIRLNKMDNSFAARIKVKTITANAGDPVLITSDEAQGNDGAILYTGNVRFWRGNAYIEAGRLRASNVANRLTAVAEENVKSTFESVRTSSDRLEYDDNRRLATYSGNVKARKQSMEIDTRNLVLTLAEKSNDVVEIRANGAVVVTRGDQRGTGEAAVYTAATDEVTLTGKPARVVDKQRGDLEGVRFVMNEKTSRITVEGDPSGRATATRKIKK
jgi:lipopolysaccharide transport protein LptA